MTKMYHTVYRRFIEKDPIERKKVFEYHFKNGVFKGGVDNVWLNFERNFKMNPLGMEHYFATYFLDNEKKVRRYIKK